MKSKHIAGAARRTGAALALLAVVSGCASTGDAPYCVKWENGEPVAFLFKPSREQSMAFDRNRDRSAIFPQPVRGK